MKTILVNKAAKMNLLLGAGGLLLAALLLVKFNHKVVTSTPTESPTFEKTIRQSFVNSSKNGTNTNLALSEISSALNAKDEATFVMAKEYAKDAIFLQVDELMEKRKSFDEVLTPEFRTLLKKYVSSGPEAQEIYLSLAPDSIFRKLVDKVYGKKVFL